MRVVAEEHRSPTAEAPLRVRSEPLDDDAPLLALPPSGEAVAWVRGGEGLVGWGTAARIEPGSGAERFVRAEAEFAEIAARALVEDDVGLPGTGLVGIGSFTFTDATPDSVLIVPRVVIGRRDGVTWRTSIDPVGLPPLPLPPARTRPGGRRDRPRYAGSSNPDLHWLEAVATAIERLSSGTLEKVVLARDHAVWSHEPFDALDLAARLAVRFPGCHTFLVDGLVGATPELLLSRFGRRVRSRVLAGTTSRSRHEGEDEALGAALLASGKDLREHRLAAASVADVLAGACDRLEQDEHPRLLRLDNVQHLATTFSGHLASPETSLQLVSSLHPSAAVGGTPRDTALAVIAELEGMERGRYAAPVGWTDPSGDGEWGIALRCAELSGARARLFAGVGIVEGSLPESELEETRLKLLAMQAALGSEPG